MRKHGRQKRARVLLAERAVVMSMFAARTVRVMRARGAVAVKLDAHHMLVVRA